MKILKKISLLLLSFSPTFFVYAQGSDTPLGGGTAITNPLTGITSITQLLNKILDIVVLIGVPILVMAVIYVGFMFVKAQGEPGELKTAREAFFWTVIGAGVVLGAKVISLAIQSTVTNLGK